MEKFNEIINAINMINDHNYKKSEITKNQMVL